MPVGVGGVDNDDAKTVGAAFEVDAFGVVDVDVDVERRRIFRRTAPELALIDRLLMDLFLIGMP